MKHRTQKHRDKERGYVLLVLLLCMAVLSIGLTVLIQGIGFETRRDREEELIHRGAQYSRAVRKFIKAFGRYPNNIEELENTNNTRCLRKRYKDPITGKDFKILHLSDLPSFKPIAGGASATSVALQQSGSPVAINAADKDAGDATEGATTSLQSPPSNDPGATEPANQAPTVGANVTPHSQSFGVPISPSGANREFGRGPMVGVVSISKTTTIREFNHKNHYNEWQFVYDPSTDRGGLLMGPTQPALQKAVQLDGQSNPASLTTLGGASTPGNSVVDAQRDSSSTQ